MDKENKLILYKDDEGKVNENVRFADEDVWLTRENLAERDWPLQFGYDNCPWLSCAVVHCCAIPPLGNTLEGNGTVSHQEAIEKAEREFEIYREREMRQLESDFDKAVKRLRNKINKDDKDES